MRARCLCVPVGIVCSFALSGRGAGLRGDAVPVAALALGLRLLFVVLSGRFALSAGLDLRFCRGVLPSVHACLFSFVRKKETACGSLRFYSAGSRSPFVRSRDVGAVICHGRFTSGLDVSLWRSRRDYRGRGERGYGERGYGVGGAA